MSKTQLSGAEFVSSVFKPTVVISSSTDAELLCVKNHLTFTDLLKPFSFINKDVILRDNNSISHCIKNLQVNFEDINNIPLQPQQIKRLQNDIVSKCFATNGASSITFTHGGDVIQIPITTPWFEAWRQIFIQNMTPSEHEFLNHYLACVFVVSTFNNDAIDQFQRLSQQLITLQQHSTSKFFNSNILRYYVLLHDQGQGDKIKADELFKILKGTFSSSNCYLLAINSVSTNTLTNNDNIHNHSNNDSDTQTDPWMQFLIPGGNLLSEMIVSADLDGVQRNNIITKEESPLNLLCSNDPLMLFKTTMDEKDSKFLSNNYHYNAGVKYSTSYPQLTSTTVNHNFNFLSHDNFLISSANDSNDMLRVKSDINKPHGQCLTPQDHERIKQFVYEFVSFGLIPWVETTLKQLGEQIAYKLKMTRTFFNVTRKFFGGNSSSAVKPNPPISSSSLSSNNLSGSASNLNSVASTKVVYTSEAIEMQMRRHGDLAFLFQQYELAHQTYNVLKKDFQDEGALLHYAGAMEMCALSILLQSAVSQRQYPQHYIDSAITIYLSHCRNFDYATRAALLNCEALKSQGLYIQASNQYIKLTSDASANMINAKENDLRSALLLEQSAHFYLQLKVPMIRKYAFYMIMAGHRFSKAGQKKHTIRCYTQALPIFKNKNLILAEDHIHATICKHAYMQRQLEISIDSLRRLLSKESRQTLSQQSVHLRDFLKISSEHRESIVGADKELLNGSLIAFPIPIVDATSIKVMIGKPVKQYEDISVEARDIQFSDTDIFDPEWKVLEKSVLKSLPDSGNSKVYGETVLSNPSCLSKNTVNSSPAISSLGEPITVQVHLENPLNIPLVLTDLYLLWQFVPDLSDSVDSFISQSLKNKIPDGSEFVTNEVEPHSALKIQEFVMTELHPELCLLPKEKKPIELSVIPRILGTVKITGLAFYLNSTSPNQMFNNYTSQSLDYGLETNSNDVENFYIKLKGKLNFTIPPRIIGRKVVEDHRLSVVVSPPMPKLKAVFSEIPKTMIVDEVMKISITFTNIGKESIKNLIVAVSPHNFLTFGFDEFSHQFSDEIYQQTAECYHVNSCTLRDDVRSICLESCRMVNMGGDGLLAPGASFSVPLWIRFSQLGCDKKAVKFLFYYESKCTHPRLKYRLLRHKADIDLKATMRFQGQFIRPRGTDNRSIFINLKMENQQPRDEKTVEFQINQITSVSDQWRFDQKFFSSNENKTIVIGPNQTYSTCLSLQPVDSFNFKTGKENRHFSNVSLNNTSKFVHSGGSPCSDFFYLQYFQNNNLRTKEGQNERHKGSQITPMSQFDDISIIIIWKATIKHLDGSKTFHEGQSHIFPSKIDYSNISGDHRLLRNNRALTLFDSSRRLATSDFSLQPLLQYSKMVNITQKFPQIVNYDFTTKSKLVIPISISLYNSSVEHVVVRLEPQMSTEVPMECSALSSKPSSSSPQITSLSSSSSSAPTVRTAEATPCNMSSLKHHSNQQSSLCANVLWIGVSSKQLRIEPSSSVDLTVKCVVTRPGVYEMHSLVVKAAVDRSASDNNGNTDQSTDRSALTFIRQDNVYSSMLIVTQQTY